MIHSWKVFAAGAVLLTGLLCKCQTNKVRGKVDVREEQGKILKIIDTYVQAVGAADADLLDSLFWKDDPHFSEIENDRLKPFESKLLPQLAIGCESMENLGINSGFTKRKYTFFHQR